jgi:hypothetical protein
MTPVTQSRHTGGLPGWTKRIRVCEKVNPLFPERVQEGAGCEIPDPREQGGGMETEVARLLAVRDFGR